MKIKFKLGGAFLLLTLLVFVSTLAGNYGLGRLSQSLNFISQRAWDAADGSMEAVIGLERLMLLDQKVVSEKNSSISEGLQKEIAKANNFVNGALKRMFATKLFSENQEKDFFSHLKKFKDSRQNFLDAFLGFTRENRALFQEFDRFEKFMEILEERGDQEVEKLSKNPDAKLTWRKDIQNN